MNQPKITKSAVARYVKMKLSTDEVWAKAALLKIFSFQTQDEQASYSTHMYNRIGFTGADAEILSSLSVQLQRKGWLSPKQMEIVMKKMKKYTRQIIECSDAEKLNKQVLAKMN